MTRSVGVLRHEDEADGILAGRGQGEALLGHLLDEEGVRDLHQHAGAVAHQRVGADGAAMLEVLEDGEAVLDDLVAGAVLQVDDEADAAGIMLARRVVEARGLGRTMGFAKGQGPRRGGVPFRPRCSAICKSFALLSSSWPASRYRSFRRAFSPGSYH